MSEPKASEERERAGRPKGRPSANRCTKFRAKLWRYPGAGSWVFALIPRRHAPAVTHGWGRTPVRARVDGHEWETSVWRDKKQGAVLAVPTRFRDGKDDGDTVLVELLPAGPRKPPRKKPLR